MSASDHAAVPPRNKKWTYGRKVPFRPPWREILRPVLVSALAAFACTGLFRIITVGSPDTLRARTNALEIAEMWDLAVTYGVVPPVLKNEREAVALLQAGIGQETSSNPWDRRIQLKLSEEECEKALKYLDWQPQPGAIARRVTYSHFGKE